MATQSATRTLRDVRGMRGLPWRVRIARRLGRELPPARCGVAWIPRLEVPGADGMIRLCDVDTAGRSRNVTDGIVRLSSGATEPQAVTVPMSSTAHRFEPGHRLRVQVSGGAFPRYARNTGTGEPLATAARLVSTDIEVYHDQARPSALVLPG
jgi:uncharacterized protein